MVVYLISGLGVDGRAFQRLELPAGLTVHHMEWIPPRPNESLSHYAARLAEKIDTSEPLSVIGLSFGGMIAVELAKLQPVQNLVIISGVACPRALPARYRMLGYLQLHRLLPTAFLKSANPFTFGCLARE